MGLLYPVTGVKFVFASSVLLCMLGWFSVLQKLQANSAILQTNCLQEQQHHHMLHQDWKLEKQQQIQSTRQLSSKGHMAHMAPHELSKQNMPKGPHKQHATHHASHSTSTTTNKKHPNKKKRLRVLMGIFTMDKAIQGPYRREFRKLFRVFPMFNDTRVCSLYDFQMAPNDELRYQCQFIYTFVVGGNKTNNARTELVDDSAPITVIPSTNHNPNIRSKDLRSATDVTFLNIQENMNDGKSQTWFKYAAMVMQQYDLDYAGKMDSDSLPYMDKFFSWAHTYLPPPPYNAGILAGVPIDKLWWQSRSKAQMALDETEDFFKNSFGKVFHLYAAGQCYILSRDLVHTVVLEAPHSHAYQEGHEDHDISAMAFHSSKPISFHFLNLQQQFWRHPVKRYKKKVRYWRTLWHNENVRLKEVLRQRREQLMLKTQNNNNGVVVVVDDDAVFVTPEQLAAPVQTAQEEVAEGEEEEEEAEVDDNGEEDNNAAAEE